MRYCKPHNRFYSGDSCESCETRVVEEAGRLPYRVTDPQEHPRCHRCWNLIARDARGNRLCNCDGDVGMPGDLPGGGRALSFEDLVNMVVREAQEHIILYGTGSVS